MYSRQEISLVRKQFWTSFGQYMAPLKGAGGDTVNWLNYKTGIRHIYFRMDADRQQASVAIEIRHPDPLIQANYFKKLQQVKNILEQATDEEWNWQAWIMDEDGKMISRVSTQLAGVNIFRQDDWPAIISFLKPRILALDEFWSSVKHSFE